MSLKDIDTVTAAVLAGSTIESSSDFIAVAYRLHQKFFVNMSERIWPIVDIESDNSHEDWVSNSIYSESKLVKKPPVLLYDCMIAYRIVLDYFLSDDIVSKRFNLDEGDVLGWKIFKELDTKYNFCRKRLINLNYQPKSVSLCLN